MRYVAELAAAFAICLAGKYLNGISPFLAGLLFFYAGYAANAWDRSMLDRRPVD